MQQLVCGKFIDDYLIANRFNNMGAKIKKEIYARIINSQNDKLSTIPLVVGLLEKLGAKANPELLVKDVILVRNLTVYSFGRATYEITELCNYQCQHCYLGHKKRSNLSLADKKEIIRLIERSGSFWLQLTGGEPLSDRDFVEVYSFAYLLGLLVTISTNGSLLNEPNISGILKKYPPHRLTISVYGATKESYETLTQTPGSFKRFVDGINWAKDARIKTRLNIITTKFNQNEIKTMIKFAEERGFQYHVFTAISPTIYGDSVPIHLMADECERIRKYNKTPAKTNRYIPCNAGKTSFHVNSTGRASICKTAREPNVELIKESINALDKLPLIAKDIFSSNLVAACKDCESRENCSTCPLILRLYLQDAIMPALVCSKYSSKGGEENGSDDRVF